MTVVEFVKQGRVTAIMKIPNTPGAFLPTAAAGGPYEYRVNGVLMNAERYERYRKANCRGLEPLQ